MVLQPSIINDVALLYYATEFELSGIDLFEITYPDRAIDCDMMMRRYS